MSMIKHFNTITRHRLLVMKYCFRLGLYRQGLLHDLSKYSPAEFLPGAKYFAGTQSPNNLERKDKGYSEAWMHHKGRNKHHYEYWTDYRIGAPKGTISPVKIPERYVLEMFCDRIAACRVYNGVNYNQRQALEYFERGSGNMLMHPQTAQLLRVLLTMLANKGEEATFRYIREHRGSLYPLLAKNAPEEPPLIDFSFPHGDKPHDQTGKNNHDSDHNSETPAQINTETDIGG